jgi:hypothetical protein
LCAVLCVAAHPIDQVCPAQGVASGQRDYPFTNLRELGHLMLKRSDAAHGHHAIRRDDNG